MLFHAKEKGMKGYYGDRWISVSKTDVYGGYDLNVRATLELERKLDWLSRFIDDEERARVLRESDTNVKAAWDQYRMALAVATE